jgi:peptidoglycan/LPS O-acetylase OafA/YrhL
MVKIQIPGQRKFLSSLEGIRGYAFLIVFYRHYLNYQIFTYQESLKPEYLPFFLLREISWVMVPIFFALSGYLICGILLDTRNREGYFSVFYRRRILRVFPVYYLTVLCVGAASLMEGNHLSVQYWAHFFYIQNLLPGYDGTVHWVPRLQMYHLWSMAVEEQFYLLWPLVIWFCRSKRTLLRVSWGLIALCCAVRFAIPLLHVSPDQAYYLTATRGDCLLLGAVMAILRDEGIYARIEPYAKYVALACFGVLLVVAAKTHNGLPNDYLRVCTLIPLGNLASAAVVMAAIENGSWLCRVCSQRWICWLGSRSYSLYLFHYTYKTWVETVVDPKLAQHMPEKYAVLLSASLTFIVTVILADLSYRFIERPAMNLKNRFKYGPIVEPKMRRNPMPTPTLRVSPLPLDD